MLFGQWSGKIVGTNNADVILSIDKLKENEEGSITISPADDHSFPCILRIIFDSVDATTGKVSGRLDRFVGFKDGRIIFPQVTDKIALSESGTIEGVIENGGNSFSCKWQTNLKFNGDAKFIRVRRPVAQPVESIISWKIFKDSIIKYQQQYGNILFRGQNNSLYPLTTRFHRAKCWDLYRFNNEKLPELFDYLGVLNRTRYIMGNDSDFGSALLLAQHHGFPTPLLDWTLSPYIAAYFAFRFQNEVTTGIKSVRVFAFHAKRWQDEKPERVQGGFVTPGITVKPLNIPLAGNPRAVAQCSRSVFSNVENIENVLHWAEFESANEKNGMPQPWIDYFDISIEDREEALKDLKAMNILERVLFPDLDTICKELGKEYFRDYFDKEFWDTRSNSSEKR